MTMMNSAVDRILEQSVRDIGIPPRPAVLVDGDEVDRVRRAERV